MKRSVNDIFIYNGRNFIKTEEGIIAYAIYVAKNNPQICGEWNEECEVHHIDGNKANDNPNNLICLSKEEHYKIHSNISAHKGVKVNVFYKNEFIGTYETITQASRKIHIPISYISMYLRGTKIKNSKYDYSDWHFENSN